MVSRLGSAIPSRASPILHTHRLNLVLTYGTLLPLPAMVSIRTGIRHQASPEFISAHSIALPMALVITENSPEQGPLESSISSDNPIDVCIKEG